MPSPLEHALQEHRDLLWGVCYRMLGCPADADDALQATCEKALTQPPADLSSPLRPLLLRVAVNQCRDELRRRGTRKSAFWLPGPIETSPDDPRFMGAEAPEARYARMQSVSLAFMVALQTLTPLQRAVLILRDVLDLSIAQTAEALDTTAGNVKMALHRARAALADGPVRPELHTRAQEERVLQALLVHLAAHNVPALTQLLAQDVRLCNDADPDQVAAHRIIVGRDKVLTFQWKTERPGGRFDIRILNGKPALVAEIPGKRAPSSGRMIGEAADGIRRRELPRRVVLWIELDARGRVAAMHVQTRRRKLAHVAFERLGRPGPRLLAAALWAAWSEPRHGEWRRAALRSGLWALRARLAHGGAGRSAIAQPKERAVTARDM